MIVRIKLHKNNKSHNLQSRGGWSQDEVSQRPKHPEKLSQGGTDLGGESSFGLHKDLSGSPILRLQLLDSVIRHFPLAFHRPVSVNGAFPGVHTDCAILNAASLRELGAQTKLNILLILVTLAGPCGMGHLGTQGPACRHLRPGTWVYSTNSNLWQRREGKGKKGV